MVLHRLCSLRHIGVLALAYLSLKRRSVRQCRTIGVFSTPTRDVHRRRHHAFCTSFYRKSRTRMVGGRMIVRFIIIAFLSISTLYAHKINLFAYDEEGSLYVLGMIQEMWIQGVHSELGRKVLLLVGMMTIMPIQMLGFYQQKGQEIMVLILLILHFMA